MSSLLLTSRSSLRVATTVPTTFARIMSESPKCPMANGKCRNGSAFGIRHSSFRGAGRLADGKRVLEVRVRTRDHVDGDELPHAPRGGRAGVGRRLDRGDVAADDRGHVAG